MSDYINRIADLMDDDEAPLDDYNDEFGDPQGLASQILQGFDFTLPLADAISEIREYGLRHNISKSMIDLACRYLLTVARAPACARRSCQSARWSWPRPYARLRFRPCCWPHHTQPGCRQ